MSKSFGLFYNRPFCNPSRQTDAWVSPNRLAGDNGLQGKVTHSWHAGKSGDCASLLHFEHRVSVR